MSFRLNFFTSIIIHNVIPNEMMKTVMIPIIKDKCSSMCDKSNYRPIAISNCLTKILKHILKEKMMNYLQTSDNQFGFKSNHSTKMSISMLK